MVTCSTQMIWCKCVFAVFSDSPVARLTSQAYLRIQAALRPGTASSYMSKFKLYLAFIVWYNLPLHLVDTILTFLEFLVQHGSKAHTLTSYVSVLSHYFKLFDIDPSPSHTGNFICSLNLCPSIPLTAPSSVALSPFPSSISWFLLVTPSPLVKFTNLHSSWLSSPFLGSPTFPQCLQSPLTPTGTFSEVTSFLATLGPTLS